MLIKYQETVLSYDLKDDCVRLKIGQIKKAAHPSNISTSWHCLNFSSLTPDEVRDEASLGFLMTANAWQLSVPQPPGGCQQLNMCELGYNGAVWGKVSQIMVELAGRVISRWVSEDMTEEWNLENTLR